MRMQRMTGALWLVVALTVGSVASGCSQPLIEPSVASSSGHVGYAKGYPETVAATLSAFEEAEGECKQLSAAFAAYPDALSGDEVDYAAVADMFERAGTVGASGAYVERAEQLEGARAFFVEEKDNINKKVAGSVGYVAKQANCTADVQSAAVVSLDKVIKDRLEAQLREANDAQRLLDRDRAALGKKNAAVLETQLDEVTRASYLSHIAMVRHKVELRRLIGEASQVEDTLAQAIESEGAYQAEAGRSDKEKADSEQRVDELKQSLSQMEAAKQNAKKANANIEKRITKSQELFRQALDKLVADLRARTKA